MNHRVFAPFDGNQGLRSDFKKFIDEYNENRILERKICEDIKQVSPEVVAAKKAVIATQTIAEAFENCKAAFAEVKQDPFSIQALLDACQVLSSRVSCLNKGDPLLEQILDFKNSVRAYCLPQGRQALKGKEQERIERSLWKGDVKALRKELKEIRRKVLHIQFAQELIASQREIDLLKKALATNTDFSPEERDYLTEHIAREEKKVLEGKPRLHPKWYHCTSSAKAQESILRTHIRYDHSQEYGGCYFANYPEHSFGNFVIALNSRVEEECNFDPVAGKIYPVQACWSAGENIVYSNQEQPYTYGERPMVWLGSLKGKASYQNRGVQPEQWMGIALEQKEKIESPFGYYQSVISHISVANKANDAASQVLQIGADLRVRVLKKKESALMQRLVENTFDLTLQPGWKGNIKHARHTKDA